VDFKQLLHLARRRWLTIAAVFAIACAISAALSFSATPQYESKARVFISADVSNAADAYAASFFSTGRVKSYADLASSVELMKQVIDELDLDLTPAELADKISAQAVPDTVLIEITVTDPDPHKAQTLARTESELFTNYIADLETPTGSQSTQVHATITNPASYEGSPVTPRTVLNLVVAGLIGLLLGYGLAVAREILDRSVHTIEEIEEVTQAPVLTSIGFDPAMKKHPLITDLEGFAPRTEAIRLLRTNLQFLDLDKQPRCLLISSAVPGEGKTSTSVNLAIALAQAGRRVLLIDGDLRRPTVAQMLGLDGAIGLTTVLVGSTDLDAAVQVHEGSGLHLLSSGPKPPNPTEILQSKLTHDLITRLRDRYDMVIIDAPPLLPVADAAVLSTVADGVILITHSGRTTREQLKEAVNRITQVGGHLYGVVVNMIPKRASHYYEYYYSEDPAPARGKH
jgi:receptor protein-tyrosine kinase